MNLFEMLDNYVTNAYEEFGKLMSVLKKRKNGFVLFDYYSDAYIGSELSAYESSLSLFFDNVILKNPIYNGLNTFEENVLKYRFLAELVLYLSNFVDQDWSFCFQNEMAQINAMINNGLKKCGYGIKEHNGKPVTYKLDINAEVVASQSRHYSEDIFDYLIAKSVSEKEKALTSFSIKLEAMKPIDGYTKNARDYIQMMRHKEERKLDVKYSWFYKEKDYSDNLEKLFKILISYLAHINCSEYVEEFDNKCHQK